jgi:hypothetical protein
VFSGKIPTLYLILIRISWVAMPAALILSI